MDTVTQTEGSLVRQARVAESLVIAWMVVELVVALTAGIAARSVALTAFGVDSGIEVFTALGVLRQLLLHTDRATEEELDARERQASRLVGWGLYGLVVYIIAPSGWSLLTQSRPESSVPGMVLGVAALLIMTPLWRWRRRLAEALDSPSLRGDAACSLVCIYMAATLLVGLLLNSLFGWWWADPVAGLAMIWWIRGEAREALEAARSGRHETPALVYRQEVTFLGDRPPVIWAYEQLSRVERPGTPEKNDLLRFENSGTLRKEFNQLYGGLFSGIAWQWAGTGM